MRSDAIAAYTYNADVYCPDCILTVLVGTYHQITPSDVEGDLDAIALNRGLDRYDERSFDSGDFPKVVFADQIGPDVYCGRCQALIAS